MALDIRYNPQDVIAVVNPIEQLSAWASTLQAIDGASWPHGLVGSLLHGIGVVFATRTFVLDSSARPTIFIEWLVIAAAIMAWKADKRMLVGQVAALMGVAWGMDAIYAVRSLQLQYFILTDPLAIIAAALLLAELPSLQAHERAYQIGTVLIAANFALSQAEPIKHTFQSSKPLYLCVEHFVYTKRIERFLSALPRRKPLGGPVVDFHGRMSHKSRISGARDTIGPDPGSACGRLARECFRGRMSAE